MTTTTPTNMTAEPPRLLIGCEMAHSGNLGPGNPMGWSEPYEGGWPELASDWAHRLEPLGAQGLFLRFADGACRRRPVGYRENGQLIWTNAASPDMLSFEEHWRRVPVSRGLAASTRLLHYTGIPADPDLYPLATKRLLELQVRHVGIDVAGRNRNPNLPDWIKRLIDEGITPYLEPWGLARDELPDWPKGVRCGSKAENALAAIKRGMELPAGSMAFINGATPHAAAADQLRELRAAGLHVSIARQTAVVHGGVDLGETE